MKVSIRLKFTAVFAIVLSAAIALCILFNGVYLERYYVRNKVDAMLDACVELEEVLYTISSESDAQAEESTAADVEAADASGQTETETESIVEVSPAIGMLTGETPDFDGTFPADMGDGERGPWENDNQKRDDRSMFGDNSQSTSSGDSRLVDLFYRLKENSNITAMVVYDGIICTAEGVDQSWIIRILSERQSKFGQVSKNQSTVVASTDEYSVIKFYDAVTDMNYLEGWGSLTDGSVFFMRTPLSSISESVKISNTFFLYIGMIVFAVGIIIMYVVMGFVTKPIVKLKALSKKMSDLDFDAKYTGKENDELGELGQHLNEMSEKLEDTVGKLRVANLELTNDIAEKEKLEQARNEFIGNVSHELKTPLAVIQGYAEGLQDGIADDPESAAYYCEVIIDETQKMNRMVKKLLTLNQLEFGKEKLEMTRFDLTALVSGVSGASTILAKQKGANIIFAQKDPVYVWGDEYKLEEVVTNYLSNAINHVSGKMEIHVEIIDDEKTTRVEVENSGSHIPEEDLEKVWDKFYKVDKAHTRSYGGNGIGLSIVKAIMDLHGGKCGVVNTDEGVKFWFELVKP